MTELPKSVAIVGGGYIGVEIAGVMNALGVDTHLCVRSGILKSFDKDIVEVLQDVMVKDGVTFHTGVNPVKIEKMTV